ncbi:helix-turn-helix domain-containing protein [Luteibacter sp. UNCMF366Tsu5.1]|uniref:helix-turn-helix domain-containing protein n=1 Tax=Luteibacter sp. UNCMF366Tsu5.1 TaxID=1502758 RepID=UPI000908D348|nr:AraC family transcriptional regulator [Luteibacter sp. UNCMF366Tsu5.1]SFW30059.1 AraC family transcriptional regulator, ethanolamine operon transcriptional activator [Luteibacter sp. UNCMF366Tsu5.1]
MSRPSDMQGLEDFDLVTLGATLGVCEVDLLTLSPVRPRAAIASTTHDGVTYLSAHIDFDVRGSLTVPEDACMLVYLHEAGERSWCQGIGVEADMAVTLLRGTPTDFMFERGTRLTLVVAPYARFRSRFLASDHADVDMAAQRLRLFSVRSEHLRRAYRQIAARVASGDAAMGPIEDLLDEHIRVALASSPEERPVASRGRRAHYQVVRRAERFMRANLRRDIYSQELCQAAGASERGLRYAFDDMLGIPPNRYLAMLRLCTAHRSLVMAEAGRRSVKSVALSCGMWDLSRFAEKYRSVFGEQPRETLTRHNLSEDMAPTNEYEEW